MKSEDLDGLVNTLNHVLRNLGQDYVTRVLDTYVPANQALWMHPTFCCRQHNGVLCIGPLGLLAFIAGTLGDGQNAVCAVLSDPHLITHFRRTDKQHVTHPHRLRLDTQNLWNMWQELYGADPEAYEQLRTNVDVHIFFFSLLGVNTPCVFSSYTTSREVQDTHNYFKDRADALHRTILAHEAADKIES